MTRPPFDPSAESERVKVGQSVTYSAELWRDNADRLRPLLIADLVDKWAAEHRVAVDPASVRFTEEPLRELPRLRRDWRHLWLRRRLVFTPPRLVVVRVWGWGCRVG